VRRLTPKHLRFDDLQHPPTAIPLQDKLAGPVRNASLMLMAGVVLILLIACTNVANLLMARTADRATELSIRSALGASRARLARQLLTECLLLSLAAAIAGLIVALWTTSIAATLSRIRRLPGVRSASATDFLPLYATGFIGGPSEWMAVRPKPTLWTFPCCQIIFKRRVRIFWAGANSLKRKCATMQSRCRK
jgi:ABC-type antimicrobial peptide transport system permease subunit